MYRLGSSLHQIYVDPAPEIFGGARTSPVTLFERSSKIFENILQLNICIGEYDLDDEVLRRRHNGI